MKKIACVAVLLGLSFVATRSHADGWGGSRDDDLKKARARGEVDAPDKASTFASWTPAQQWNASHADGWGYGGLPGALLFADELGDRLSETGRAAVVMKCFENVRPDMRATLRWALCGSDAQQLDLKKMDAELKAEGMKDEARAEYVKAAQDGLDTAKKVGEVVAAAAKNDPGLQKYLKIADDAKADWNAYASKNKEQLERYRVLKDAVRTGKSNDPAFKGCYEATYAPFAKVVKAAAPKIPWDVGNDQLIGYMHYLITSPESYIATVSWAACAWSVDKSGEAPYAASASADFAGMIHGGWRTHALSKYLDKDLPEPKFADRSLNMREWKDSDMERGVKMVGINDVTAITTPSMGEIAKLTPKDDMITLRFKGDKVEECLQWVDPGLGRDKVCKKRGMVDNDEGSADVPAKYLKAHPGEKITLIDNFPVATWKGKKVLSILGVAL